MWLGERNSSGHRYVRVIGVRLALLFAVFLPVAGCSQLSFIYGLAGSALEDEAAFFLDLDEEDERLVDRKIDEFLAWHDAAMLPRYAQFMKAQADLVAADKVDRVAVTDAVEALRLMLDDLVRGAAPYVAEILANHTTPDKLGHLERRMTERLEERRSELAEPEDERLEARIEKITDNLERFTGDLEDAQISRIRLYATQTVGANKRWLDARVNRQRAFLNFLAQEPSRAEITSFLHKIVLHGHEIVDPAYQSVSKARWQLFNALLADIMLSLSAEQRETMAETLRDYAAELQALSA